MKQNYVYILIGPPNCGKTTWRINNLNINDAILSNDDIILELSTNSNNYNLSFKEVNFKNVNKLFNEKFLEAIKNNKNIIIDKTNMTIKSRKKLLSKIPKHYKKIAVLFEWDRTVLLERNINRNKTENKYIPINVIDNFIENFQSISDDEIYDEIININSFNV